MRISIVAADNFVFIDKVQHTSDCGALIADGVSAVQWHDDKGEIEFVGHEKPNQQITSFSPFQKYVDKAVPVPTTYPGEKSDV